MVFLKTEFSVSILILLYKAFYCSIRSFLFMKLEIQDMHRSELLTAHLLKWENTTVALNYACSKIVSIWSEIKLAIPPVIWHCSLLFTSVLWFHAFQCCDACPAASARPWRSAVREPDTANMSGDTPSRPEPDLEHHAELADLVAAMNVAATRVTSPNGYRSSTPRAAGPHRARLSDRKMSLQERGSRIARQPTIETKRVSITDADVRSQRSDTQVILMLRPFNDQWFCFPAGLCPAQPVQTEWRHWKGQHTSW